MLDKPVQFQYDNWLHPDDDPDESVGGSVPEPATCQYSATNSETSLQRAGAVGLRAALAGDSTNTPVLFTFDRFRVTNGNTAAETHVVTYGYDPVGNRTGVTVDGMQKGQPDAQRGQPDGGVELRRRGQSPQ